MQYNRFVDFNMKKNNIRHVPNKNRICAHIFNVRALDAKQKIDSFWPIVAITYFNYNHYEFSSSRYSVQKGKNS